MVNDGVKATAVGIGRRPGRPRDAGKAAAILDVAWALFLEFGIEATSIETIAAQAHVSKVTLYSHYADKAVLFRAAVLREMERIEAAQSIVGTDQSAAAEVDERLRTFGVGVFGYLMSKPAIDFYAVVAGELRRHDSLAQSFYELGPGRTRANLATLLAAAAASGQLAPLDPGQAADELFGLWQGFSNFQLSLDIGVAELRGDLEARIGRGVSVFMRAYGPRTNRL